MMLRRGLLPACAFLGAAIAVLLPDAQAAAQRSPAATLKLERVVMLMRHGIRPPTKANPLPAGYTEKVWPKWSVGPGLLTERGAAGAARLGGGDRAYFVERGLLPRAGCPSAAMVTVTASAKQRAIRTAESYVASLLPDCGVTVSHPEENGDDPLFHGLDDKPTSFDGHAAFLEAESMSPKGGVQEEAKRYAPYLGLLQRTLGCCGAPVCTVAGSQAVKCSLSDLPTDLVEQLHDRPDLTGPLDVGSTASQSFLLEYLEGMPMQDVAWGLLSRAQVESLLVLHPVKFRYSNRPAYIAARAGAPLAKAMADAVAAPATAPRLVLFVGHDTNLADFAGAFDTHWQVPSYPADDIPPGAAVGFELLSNEKGAKFVRAFIRAQGMDQLRNLDVLDAKHPPYRAYITLPGCGAAPCPLAQFSAMVSARIKNSR